MNEARFQKQWLVLDDDESLKRVEKEGEKRRKQPSTSTFRVSLFPVSFGSESVWTVSFRLTSLSIQNCTVAGLLPRGRAWKSPHLFTLKLPCEVCPSLCDERILYCSSCIPTVAAADRQSTDFLFRERSTHTIQEGREWERINQQSAAALVHPVSGLLKGRVDKNVGLYDTRSQGKTRRRQEYFAVHGKFHSHGKSQSCRLGKQKIE
jgi:hypothetical protein